MSRVRVSTRPCESIDRGADVSYSILGRQGLPIFTEFFLWSVGTGAIQLARPLFAASFGVPVFLVSLITSSNAAARLVSGPITGFLMDRWGRKPLLVVGVVLRGMTALWEYYATSYLEFLIAEFIGGIGVSIWATGSNILIADVSDPRNRGMVVATRSFSFRLGTIGGPAIGAALALAFGLRSIFLFNAITKVVMLVILLFLIRETRPDPVRPTSGQALSDPEKLDLSMFMSKPVLAVIVATLMISTMSQGVMQALFPVFAQDIVGLSAADIGVMMTLTGVTALAISLPNGWVVDKFGRKISLVPGLIVLGASSYLLGIANDYRAVVLMALVYGIGEGMAMGSSQTYAMDLAPEQRRGAFLGMWSLLQNGGGIITPFSIGVMADLVGFGPTFTVVAICLALSALVMAIFGAEPAGRRVQHTAPGPTAAG